MRGMIVGEVFCGEKGMGEVAKKKGKMKENVMKTQGKRREDDGGIHVELYLDTAV
jgi:hypothetical protein